MKKKIKMLIKKTLSLNHRFKKPNNCTFSKIRKKIIKKWLNKFSNNSHTLEKKNLRRS